jgi:hypothetical protein
MQKEFVNKYTDLTDEELAAQALNEAIEHAKITLQLSENCYRKFGKQIMSDAQIEIFQTMAKGILPTDAEMEIMNNEQITFSMEAIKKARQINIQKAEKLGVAYQPEFILEDKTDLGIN